MITKQDTERLRELAKRYHEIAASPKNLATRQEWVRFNTDKEGAPKVIVDEIPWAEMDIDGELQNKCEGDFAKTLETFFLRNLYIHKHLTDDHVFDDYIKMAIPIVGCDYGISAQTIVEGAQANRFADLLEEEKDIEKIRFQPISVLKEEYEKYAGIYEDIFHDILPIRHCGRSVLFNAWDLLETWHGVENCLIDMVDRPEFLHAIMRRITDVTHHMIDELEKLRLLEGRQESFCYSPLYCEWDVSSEEGTGKNAWTFGAAQIFSSASKDMHEEFELPYAKEIFARFRNVYYGCCEPLHDRMDMVDKMPNIRKVSISPFANARIAAENIGKKYIMSRKPTPAYVAMPSMNWDIVEAQIKDTLEACAENGVAVEFILKDITTVCHQPQRLWEWSRRAKRLVDEFEGKGR